MSILSTIKNQIITHEQKDNNNKNFVIVSNNCWGAEFYKHLNLPFNTPFVGLYIMATDYIKLLENFEQYLNMELVFTENSKWSAEKYAFPIGVLGDIEIHFMHYKSNEEALDKWNRRLERMKQISDYSNFFFKICDRDGGNAEILERFHKLPFSNKVSFGVHPFNNSNHIKIKEHENKMMVPDGLKLYRIGYKYKDFLHWIEKKQLKNTWYNQIKNILRVN